MNDFFRECEVTQRAVATHSFSGRELGGEPDLVRNLLGVKRVAARANREAGVIGAAALAAIEAATEALAKDSVLAEAFRVDPFQGGGGIGVHTNVNEAIAACAARSGARLGIADEINASQSTSDVVATALRLTIAERSARLAVTLGETSRLADAKSIEFRGVKTAARTCLRDAMPTSLGGLLGGHARLWRRAADEVALVGETMLRVNLGGTVIGDGRGASEGYRRGVERELKAWCPGASLRDDLCDAAQNSDDLARVMSATVRAAQAAIKVGRDLRLLSSGPRTGFGELELPALIPGSTFFKGKSNPTLAETMIQAAFLVVGWQRTVELCVEHAELQLNVFDLQAGLLCLDALRVMDRVMGLVNVHCLAGLKADVARCAELARLTEEGRS